MGGYTVPYAPQDYYRPSNLREMTELILRGGDIGANRLMAQGQARSNMFSGIGDALSQGVTGYAQHQEKQQEEQQLAARDEAFLQWIGSGEGFDDPKNVLAGAVKLFGPKGLQVAEGIMAFQRQQSQQTVQDEEQTLGDLSKIVAVGDALSDAGRQQLFPAFRSTLEKAAPVLERRLGIKPEMIPQEYPGPEGWSQISQLARALSGQKDEAYTLSPGQKRMQGNRVIAEGASEPPKADTRALVEKLADPTLDPQRRADLLKAQGDIAAAGRAPERVEAPVESNDDVSFLLQGGTADKLPIKARSQAVAAARASGGVEGTGFVPNNAQQQTKFSDFMDLRRKAMRMQQLLEDNEVRSKLGPVMGRAVDWTKELPGIGQSTKVKEAFDLFRDLSDKELRKRSGAAISPNEYERIVGFTIDPTKQWDSNTTNLRRMLEAINNGLKTIGASNLPGPTAPQVNYLSTDPDAGERVQ